MPGPSLSIREQCPIATETNDGLMSKEQVQQLDSVAIASLQTAYNNGRTINIGTAQPVQLNAPADGSAVEIRDAAGATVIGQVTATDASGMVLNGSTASGHAVVSSKVTVEDIPGSTTRRQIHPTVQDERLYIMGRRMTSTAFNTGIHIVPFFADPTVEILSLDQNGLTRAFIGKSNGNFVGFMPAPISGGNPIPCGDEAGTNEWTRMVSSFYSQSAIATVASASTIAITRTVSNVSGVVAINNITPPYTGFIGTIVLIPTGLWTTTAIGNISLATTAVVGRSLHMTFDGSKWNPSYV